MSRHSACMLPPAAAICHGRRKTQLVGSFHGNILQERDMKQSALTRASFFQTLYESGMKTGEKWISFYMYRQRADTVMMYRNEIFLKGMEMVM